MLKIIPSLELLGYVHPDTGTIISTVAVYYAKVSENDRVAGHSEKECDGIVKLSLEEIRSLIRDGEIRDGFTLNALFLYILKDL